MFSDILGLSQAVGKQWRSNKLAGCGRRQ